MAALMLGFSATAFAQEVELNAALEGIKSKAPNAAELAKNAYKKRATIFASTPQEVFDLLCRGTP